MFDLTLLDSSPFYEFTALLVLASAFGLIGLILKQPTIVSFLFVGILAGSSGLGIVKSYEKIEVLSELGIALLLFLVGLKLDLKLIKTLGFVSLATGLGQVIFTSVLGLGIGLVLGLDFLTSLFIAIALTFSSTIIIIKLLSDKKEVDTLHGKIAVGFLIVQDLVVVVAMLILSALGINSSEAVAEPGIFNILKTLVLVIFILGLLGIFIKYVANPLTYHLLKAKELIIIFAIAWASLFAAIGNEFGFSKELGGLLAGISLASTPFRENMISRLASLRDFLILFFFIALGSRIDVSTLGEQIFPAMIFSMFVLIGNPLIVMVIMGFMGYRKRTSFMAGLTVAQISEFSLIFIAMAISLNFIPSYSLGLVTLVGLITITLSVYMITYSNFLYNILNPFLKVFERRNPYREKEGEGVSIKNKSYDIIVFGVGRFGREIAINLEKAGLKVLAIDHNPEIVKRRQKAKYDVQYGDAFDQLYLQSLPLEGVKWIIAAMSQHDLGVTHDDPRVVLIDGLKQIGFAGKVAVSTYYEEEAVKFREFGADLVFIPYKEAASLVFNKLSQIEMLN